MATQGPRTKTARQGGFSLLELLVSMAILMLVVGVVVEGVSTMQTRNAVEVNRVDLTQQSRQFMDQIVNDMHQSGFPRIGMFQPSSLVSATDCTQDNNVACGLISLSSTAVQFEGDVDGSGVSEVYINLAVPAGGCPCTIQRGTVLKSVGGTPPYYTEVTGVMNSTVFTAYDNDGITIALPIASKAWSNNISAIGITLFVRSSQPDAKTGQFPSVTMVSTVKINN